MALLDDLDDFLDEDDFAVSLTANGVTGKAIPQVNSEIYVNGEMVIVDNLPIVRTDLFGGLKHGDTAILDGLMYSVLRDAMRFDDGAFSYLPLTGPITPSQPTFRVITTSLGAPLTTTLGAPLTTLPLPANA